MATETAPMMEAEAMRTEDETRAMFSHRSGFRRGSWQAAVRRVCACVEGGLLA